MSVEAWLAVVIVVAYLELLAILWYRDKATMFESLRDLYRTEWKRECEFSDRWRRECFLQVGIPLSRDPVPPASTLKLEDR